MIIRGAWFGEENKKKQSKTNPNTKFFPLLNGRSNNQLKYSKNALDFWILQR